MAMKHQPQSPPTDNSQPSFLNSKFPVFIPESSALRLSGAAFDNHVQDILKCAADAHSNTRSPDVVPEKTAPSEPANKSMAPLDPYAVEHSFRKVQLSDPEISASSTMDNKMLTENADVAFRSSTSSLVDLFQELEEVISGPRLQELLEAAWSEDGLVTLKIIWNSRSIHLGKSSRTTFYRCCGWLAQNHPRTLLINLEWLTRPLIPKKATEKKTAEDNEDDMVVVERDFLEINDVTKHDVKNGVAHGYWKDLLNLLALAANDELGVLGDPSTVLNIKDETKKHKRDWALAKQRRDLRKLSRHEVAVAKLNDSPFYRALHLSVARLFADQLKVDKELFKSGKKKDLTRISLAAKWAPSLKGFHDQHTFIASSIAEILYPHNEICPEVPKDDRILYLKHAREAYRRLTLSPLRKALEVVEREITANTFENIKYDRVPSIAMNNYTPLFAKKDFERFDKYIDNVAQGKARISGATLLPSTLISMARQQRNSPSTRKNPKPKDLVEDKIKAIAARSIDGQWKTLVKRIRDSGTVQSSIAVCDVSGSMTGPVFKDGTSPIDSAIGLSLLLAEVTQPPFGGRFITFSACPKMQLVGGETDTRSLAEKVQSMEGSTWHMNTNFVAVFEELLLPMAIENKLSQEDMVKQIFVFSDMQFDQSQHGTTQWSSSYERIQEQFKNAGYEMPKLIFWNLAGGRAGYGEGSAGDPVAPKPVTADEEGTALVSGYSQGQMKMFLENGQFGEDEEEVVEEVVEGEDEIVQVKKKVKMDPLIIMRKAISHQAYEMLKVVD